MAIDFGVRTDHDEALVRFTLAEIYLKKGQIEEAKKYLEEVKNIPHKPSLNVYLKKFEDNLYQNT